MSAATAQPNLGCTLNYPDPRAVALAVCRPHKFVLGIDTTPANQAYSVGIRAADCNTLEACITSSPLGLALGPGMHSLVFEGYGGVDGSAGLTFSRPTQLVPKTDCCAAQQEAQDFGPVSAPMTLSLLGLYSSVTGYGPSCAPDAESTSVTALELAAPTQITVIAPPLVGKQVGYVSLRSSCQSVGSDLACAEGPNLFTRAVGPGVVYVATQNVTIGGALAASVILETPPAPTANLACTSAVTLPINQPYQEERIVGGTADVSPGRFLRYYKFTTSATGSVGVQLVGGTGAGSTSFSIRSNCLNATSELGSGQILGTQTTTSNLAGLPGGTYSVVVSADEGVKYTLRVNAP